MKIKHNIAALICCLNVGFVVSPVMAADAPVVNGYANATTVNVPDNDLSQRLALIEKQISGMEQLKLLQKIDAQQSEIQTLRGQLEVQQHAFEQLKKQQQTYYQDLDQRLVQLSSASQTKADAPIVAVQTGAAATTGQPALDKTADAESSYKAAYQYIQDKQYDTGIRAMQNYLREYPSSKYTVNAHYWLGELYLTQNQLDKASQQFTTVMKNYPNNPKVPDAMLKQAYILLDKNSVPQATELLTKITTQYPNSASATLATNRLAKLATATQQG